MENEDLFFTDGKQGPTVVYAEGVLPSACDLSVYTLGSPFGDEYILTLRVVKDYVVRVEK